MKLILISLGTSWRLKASSRACRAQHLLIGSYKKTVYNKHSTVFTCPIQPSTFYPEEYTTLCSRNMCVQLNSNKEIVLPSKKIYDNTLAKSGYTYNIQYNPDPNFGRSRGTTRTRRREVIYFNPPWDNCVHSQIWRDFLTLVDRCFQQGHKLRRICNRNRVKVTYSTMPSME